MWRGAEVGAAAVGRPYSLEGVGALRRAELASCCFSQGSADVDHGWVTGTGWCVHRRGGDEQGPQGDVPREERLDALTASRPRCAWVWAASSPNLTSLYFLLRGIEKEDC